MDFRILGPFEVHHGDATVDLRAAKPRALLAVLALRPGRVVAVDSLAAALWGDEPPRSVANTLQTYISQLRRTLGADVIQTRPPGYVLAVSSDAVDAARFENLVKEAQGALGQGDPAAAEVLLQDALALWRGDPLADFAFEPYFHLDITRLQELRTVAEEERAEAGLALGRHTELIGRLRTLVEAHPLRERLWGQLVTALYRSGRQAEALRSLGDVRRRLAEELGIEPGPALRQLEEDVLLQREQLQGPPAAAATPTQPASNLPPARSSFIGRDGERRQLARLLAVPGLVTIVGAGGVGKTRLATEVARGLAHRFPHGVFLVELAALREPALVPQAVAESLGVREEPREAMVDTLARHIARRRLLLILDNCEHLIDAAASLADSLLEAGPDLAILATSRDPLRIAGEEVFALAPLPVPERVNISADALSEVDAVHLFRDRAALQGTFTITPQNAAAVAALCRRLDGIPLAIELAAARTRSLTPEQMLPLLDDRFAFLTTGPRTAAPRHQTLRAAVEWSHNLLSPAERAVFHRLSAFAGNFSMEAAMAVGSSTDIDSSQMVNLVASLVDHSLIVPVEVGGGRRYLLLETLKAYAQERLTEADEDDETRARLLRWACAFAESFAEALDPGRTLQPDVIDRVDLEDQNLHQALRWGLDTDPNTALRLFVALGPFWANRGYFSDAHRWAEELLAVTPDASAQTRAMALRWAGRLFTQGSMGRAVPLLTESLALFRQLGDRRNIAYVLGHLSWIANDHQCDLDRAAEFLEEEVAIYAEDQNEHLYAESLGWLAVNNMRRGRILEAQNLEDEAFAYNTRHSDDPCPVVFMTSGEMALLRGDHARARDLIGRALQKNLDVGGRAHIPSLVGRLGRAALVAGDFAEASARFGEQLALAREIGVGTSIEEALRGLSTCAIHRGEAQQGRSLLGEALRLAASTGRVLAAQDLEIVAALLLLESRPDAAARALGAAEARREHLGTPIPPAEVPGWERLVADVAACLDPADFRCCWQSGRELAPEAVVAMAFNSEPYFAGPPGRAVQG